MSCQRSIADSRWHVAYIVLLLIAAPGFSKTTLLFTGDILLSREVAREVRLKQGQSPWVNLRAYFKNADWLMGNFEGSVGFSSQCVGDNFNLCFAVKPAMLDFLKKAGFTAVSIENNHVADLGEQGRMTTRHWLNKKKLSALDFEHSPAFIRVNKHIIGLVAFSQIKDKNGFHVKLPSPALKQKIKLAKSLSDWVIVSVHWGSELSDWPNDTQREAAAWLIQQGADVVIGHHPHVIQAVECIQNHPVFFSLGNHVFDQKYPETKKGLLARCEIAQDKLICTGIKTTTSSNSAFPQILVEQHNKKQAIENCAVAKKEPLKINGYTIRLHIASHEWVDGNLVLEVKKETQKPWLVRARHILSLEKARFIKEKPFLFTLEKHLSDMDDMVSPRPYIYDIGPHGLVVKWRGSALAWPLVDALLIHNPDEHLDYVCALHRKDSYITLNPDTPKTRVAVYRWNGFGFSGVRDEKLARQCRDNYQH